MEDTSKSCIREEYFFEGQVLKQVMKEGSGVHLTQNSRLILSESIYSETSSSLISEYPEKHYKIISYPENSTISVYDTLLLSMSVKEEAWIKCPYTLHNIAEAPWDTIWYHITIKDLIPDFENLSLAHCQPFLREQRIGENKSILKRVLREGMGKNATVSSRVQCNYEITLENGSVIETATGRSFLLTRNPSPGVHSGIHYSLYTMRKHEEALLKLPPGFHIFDKFKEHCVWVRILVDHIEFSENLYMPQFCEFISEEILHAQEGVIKRIVKEGKGPTMQNTNKIWVVLEGRLEDGYQFQKPKDEVISLNGSKIYSEALVLGIASMKRGEVSWIKAPPSTHIYKEGYEKEVLWFKITIKEYLERFNKLNNAMTIDEKIENSRIQLEIAKRLYESGTKKDCRVIYNDIVTALKLKKNAFSEFSEELKQKFCDVKGRAMMNVALMMLKDVEESEKEDFKLNNIQKVIDLCNELLTYDNQHVKAYYRRGTAYFLKKMFEEALRDFEKVTELDKKNHEALKYIGQIKKASQKSEKKEKKVYKGIFNSNKWAEETEKEEKKREIDEEKLKIATEKWSQEQEELKTLRNAQIEEYEKALQELEKGTVIDTGDAANPLTELFLLDPN